MLTCSSCEKHVLASDAACPHCGAGIGGGSVLRTTAAVALLGLALVGCNGRGEMMYGVPDSGDSADTADTADSGDDTGDDTGDDSDDE
jgi:hypothetical protein